MKNKPWIEDFITMEDGYKGWAPPEAMMGGWFTAEILREIADDLDAANRKWHSQVTAYFVGEDTRRAESKPTLHHKIWQGTWYEPKREGE